MTPYLSMAPIQGITNYVFRNCFAKHFGSIDQYYAPYLRIDKPKFFTESKKKDLYPEFNMDIELTPQIMVNNTRDFLELCSFLNDLGYQNLNWNLGCPYPMVTNRKLGAGLLPYSQEIFKILDAVLPKINQKVSIKLRSGLTDNNELQIILPGLNKYPLSEIIIHPRYAKQLYKEKANIDLFIECLPLSNHKMGYNGDIDSTTTFNEYQLKIPAINHFMLGRGLIANPFLAQEIKHITLSESEKKRIFEDFHAELFEGLIKKLNSPATALIHIKGFWEYFSLMFSNKRKVFKAIKKNSNPDNLPGIVNSIILKEEITPSISD